MAETTDWISRLNDLARVDDLDSALTRLLFLPIAAFFVQAANAVEAITGVLIQPLNTFGIGLGSIVNSILGGASNIIQAGAQASATDISVFGLFAFPFGLVVAFAGAFVLAIYLDQDQTSDFIPFSFTDIPFIGTDEDVEEE